MAKTIFHTTEKSNFILNMTEEQYSSLAVKGLITALFAVPLFTLVPEIADKTIYVLSAAGLAVAGVINMILALIAIIKKYIDKRVMLPVCAMGALVAWGVVSLVNGYDMHIALYGYSDRGEGLLAILFYFGFFTTAVSIKREKARASLIKGIIGLGLLNSFISVVQILTGKLGQYELADLGIETRAASGLSMSPLFLAMVLTLSLTAALIAFVTSESKKYRIICICSAALFSFVMMFTYSLIGICGLVFSVIAAVVAVFVMKAPKLRLVSVLAAAVPAALAVIIVNAGLIGNISSYRLYDGRTLWWADAYMRASASGSYNAKVVDIDDTMEVYSYLNDKTMNIIHKYPWTGTGPEQLVFPQLYTAQGFGENTDISYIIPFNTGTFDKVYNEYLYTAATRGIPSLIALVLVLVPSLIASVKSLRKKRDSESMILTALLIGGVLLFFIGCSSISFAPVFWAAAGASCADTVVGKKEKSPKNAAKKK